MKLLGGKSGTRIKIVITVCVCASFIVGCVSKVCSEDKEGTKVVDNRLRIEQMSYDIKKVALTFDDGPNGIYTEKLLDGLKERNVKATFFITGENIKENENLIVRMHKEGHLLGNHTFSHVNLGELSFEEACREINETNAYIYNLTGFEVSHLRPPFGVCSEKVKNEMNMAVVMWDVDPLDWKDQSSDIVKSRILKNVKSGDIILLHDIFPSSVDAALNVVDELQRKGYVFVRIDEMNESKKITGNCSSTKEETP